MIKFRCSNCNQEFGVAEEYAGKRVRCPKCKQAMQVPEAQGEGEQNKPALIKFHCPNCKHWIRVPTSYADKRVRCAKCGQASRVPKPTKAAGQEKEAVIKFHCPSCNQKIGVPQSYAGKRVRCAKCQKPLEVPKPKQEVVPSKSAGSKGEGDEPSDGMMWNEGLLAAAAAESSAPAAEDELRVRPPEPVPQAEPQSKLPQGGPLSETEFGTSDDESTSKGEGSGLSGGVRILLGIVCGLAFTLVAAAIWAWLSSVLFGAFWFDVIDVLVMSVIAAGAFGLVLVTRKHRVVYGLLGILIGLIGAFSGKLLIARWVVGPGLKETINTKLEEIQDIQISDKMVKQTLANYDSAFPMVLMQLVENGEFEEEAAGRIIMARMTKSVPPDLREQMRLAEQKVRKCFDDWSDEKKEAVVRAQWPKTTVFLAQAAMRTKVGSAIGFALALAGAFSLWDLLWFPMGIWSAYKIGAGRD